MSAHVADTSARSVSATETGTMAADEKEEPAAVSVAVTQLIGAVLFAAGSACFVWMAWADEWVLPWRIGCVLWIFGCVPYLWPPCRQEYFGPRTAAAHLSNVLQVCGMISWAVGSAFAFLDNVDTAMQVNAAGYLAGSACLLCDAVLQARAFCSASPVPRDERFSLLADLFAGLFYVLAGVFGGYAKDTALLRFGNVCWLVGSLISGVRPCLAILAGMRRGRPTAGRTCVELEATTAGTATKVPSDGGYCH